MELDELEGRLGPFCEARYSGRPVSISDVHKMPGHAGFAYGFTVTTPDVTESWFLRLPPPNVNWRGTADVLRQVCILNALDGTDVPHCSVRWSGDDLEWFDRPYFVVPKLEGDVLRLQPGEWAHDASPADRRSMAEQAMQALAGIHRVDWQQHCQYLGEPVPFDEDVKRWDRLFERAADPEKLSRAPDVRRLLLENIPHDAPVGVFHGDFQVANLFYSPDYRLLAVIDFELVGIGATLNDVGWVATFNDPEAWAPERGAVSSNWLPAEELVALYAQAWGEALPDIGWFRALAAYKFALISGFNLMLHRRGKREDETWETTALSMPCLIDRAMELLESGADR